ncbi:DUF6950 family protein [Cereibacter azotoformans]|uniref:DUF6950 domain-containing protein n=1 Tax=Cereibacter azotoformans TaxID=43057 RepID=A0A2T5JSF0_9RHOB|nr:hypothetical protein [Cereibacter azotoformans]MBO4168865.1 hypothetical protein [Cereibacter azotoformans]PTR11141.1 hypothetical protein C8J28_1282 [Cereibacter azotoformans]
MTRLPDWRPRLVSFVAEAARRPFAWGQHDCGLFVGGAVEAMTGEDPAAGWRGRYTSFERGLLLVRREGFEDHVGWYAARFPEIPPLMAQVGDIAVVEGDGGRPALGIVQGEGIYVLQPGGLAVLPLTLARRAFRV